MADKESGSPTAPRTSLDSIFSAGPKPVTEEKEETPKKKAKDSDSKKDSDSEKAEKKPSPDKEKKADKKADPEKKDQKKPVDSKESESDDDAEKKPSPDSENKEDKAKDDPWESEENPYKKRYSDTRDYATTVQQRFADQGREFESIKHQLEVMSKKQDGTWTEEDERKETVQPEDVARTALRAGKALAARESAYESLGREQVDGLLGEFHQLFGQNEMIQNAVMNADNPVLTAFRILNRHKFEGKYGDTPEKIHASISKEVKDSLEKEIRKQILEEIREGKKLKDENVEGMSSSRGSSGSDGPKAGPKVTPLKKLFG